MPRRPVSDLEVLTPGDLNRALLSRQMLLERSDRAPLAAVRHLAGMQSQSPLTAYTGLWTRLRNFESQSLAELLIDRRVVRIALMRSTVHLVATEDASRWRPALQIVLDRSLKSVSGKQLVDVDPVVLVKVIEELFADGPQTLADLSAKVIGTWPTVGTEHLSRAIRTWMSLVQPPPRGVWGTSGPAAHYPLKTWVSSGDVGGAELGSAELGGAELGGADDSDLTHPGVRPVLEELVLRYLAAYGPATIRDMQHWSGLTKLAGVVAGLSAELVTFSTVDGVLLFDLPHAPRPGAAVPAPVRYLPEFDSLLLSHSDRSRVMSEEDRLRVFTENGIIRSSILVDGRVAGLWKAQGNELRVDLFGDVNRRVESAIVAEGRQLLSFLRDGETGGSVHIN